MFYLTSLVTVESMIDAFQSAKRTATNYVITDPILNKAANRYIDEQSAFAKMLWQNTMDVLKYHLEQDRNRLWSCHKDQTHSHTKGDVNE